MADLVLGLAKSAVEGTLTMAKTALEEEAKLKKSVQRDLMLISDEFEVMHSVLNVAKDHVTDDVTRTLVRQVRNMALDVEDCLESGVHLDSKCNWWRYMLPTCVLPAALGADLDAAVADIELLKSRVEAMGHRNLRYSRISDSGPKPSNQAHQQAVTNATTSDIFATARDVAEKRRSQVDLVTLINKKYTRPEGDREHGDNDEVEVEEVVVEEQQIREVGNDLEAEQKEEEVPLHSFATSTADALQLRVISVLGTRNDVGMMSIRKAYDDPETCNSFRCRAWVKLMHPFNAHEFIQSLLSQFYKNHCPQQGVDVLDPTEVMGKTDHVLIVEFKKLISNHRYLVVLEDVSTMVEWETVRVYLPDKNNGSCIVVHTQQLGIASLCVGHPQRVSELERFSIDHSVSALFKEDAAGELEETVDKKKIAYEWLQQHPLVGRQKDLIWFGFRMLLVPGFVISVWGMPGVGKSFLVKHIYCNWLLNSGDDTDIKHFGWVNVPHPFNLMTMSRSLLLDLNPRSLQRWMMPTSSTLKDPVQECSEYLQKYDCVIVIDGLQSTEEWDLIKTALELGTNERQHNIFVITNEESVAKHCASYGDYCVFNVQGLVEVDHAMEILRKRIWSWDEMSTEMIETTRHILHKCGGLPKVICAAAAAVNEIWNDLDVIKGNLVSLLEANVEVIHESLEDLFTWLLSYFRSCPDFIKPCIFYLTIFPLNHAIRRRRLVRRWIAEGYARDNKESTADENGETSLSKLINVSMIQVPRITNINNAGIDTITGNPIQVPTIMVNTRMPLCQVNGFLREYIISRSMEENLVFALDGHSSKNLQRIGRHLSIDKSWDRDRNVFESIDFSRLQSLTVFGKWESFFISSKMRLLRVLDLEDVSSGVTNSDVELMVKLLPRLKFLSLRRCRDITHLPDSLGDLKQLQTLDIRGTSAVKLPKTIIRLEKLQYVRAGTMKTLDSDASMVQESAPAESPSLLTRLSMNMPRATLVTNLLSKLFLQHHLDDSGGVKVPRGIGNLSSMHTLGVINISAAGDEDVLEEIKKLTQLHKLGVSGINRNNSRKLFAVISGLAHLKSLSLQVQQLDEEDNQGGCLYGISKKTIENLQSLKLYGLQHTLPLWTKELNNLRKLSLQMTRMTQEEISVLPHRELKSLRLFMTEFSGDRLYLGGFTLKFLEISCNSSLQASITIDKNTLHGYNHVEIEVLRLRCFTTLVSGLQDIDQLNEVWLCGPSAEAHKQHYETEIDKYPVHEGLQSKPVLRLEELGSSTQYLWTSW
ncbi:unnamed protein product [Urochloa decumbens]|uniref:Uncharacterized protein n=1 Tax=Urochloa decumbens TaxID=240449 RepID=A0ABC9ASQ4_9POAL